MKRLAPTFLDLVQQSTLRQEELRVTFAIGQIGVDLVRACGASEVLEYPDTMVLPHMLAFHSQQFPSPSSLQPGVPHPEASALLKEALSVTLRHASEPVISHEERAPSLRFGGHIIGACENVLSNEEIESSLLAAIHIGRDHFARFPNQCTGTLVQELLAFANFQSSNGNYEKCRETLEEAIVVSDACGCNRKHAGDSGLCRHANIVKPYAQCMANLSHSQAHKTFRLAIVAERLQSKQVASRVKAANQHPILQLLRSFGHALRDDGRHDESWGVFNNCVSISRSFCRWRTRHTGANHDYNDEFLVRDLEDLATHPHTQLHMTTSCNLLAEGVRICQDARRYHDSRSDVVSRDIWTPRYETCLRKYATALLKHGRLLEAWAALGEIVDLIRSECSRNSQYPHFEGVPAFRLRELVNALVEFEGVSAQAGYNEQAGEARRERVSVLSRYPLAGLGPFRPK